MTRSEFEAACRERNAAREAAIVSARLAVHGTTPCKLETMFAFGGIDYCVTHGVMGQCPYGTEASK